MRVASVLRLCGAVALSAGLGGCVAAIPLAASGLVVKSGDGPNAARPPIAEQVAESTASQDIVVSGTIHDANRTEDFVAMALYALEHKESGSSVLPDPGAGEDDSPTFACAGQIPAILVDLDPGDRALRPEKDINEATGLAPALALARQGGMAVLWTSVLDESRADVVRGALLASGLDPAGRDPLLLTRDPAESKTERRDQARGMYCIKAIVGDRRGDFDALLNYLRDPDAPTPYDALFGQGWFELPPPLDEASNLAE